METDKVLSNNHLSPDVAEHINGLIARYDNYVSSHPELRDLATISAKLHSLMPELKIKKGSRYIIREVVKYDEADKTLYIGEIKEGVDFSHLILKELIRVNLSKKNTKKSITEGFASIVARNVAGDSSDVHLYLDEEVAVCLLSQIVGFENMASYAVSGNNTITPKIKELGVNEAEVTNLLSLIEHNYELRKTAGHSSLDEIQNRLIDLYFKKPELNKDEVENFKLSLCDDAGYVDHSMYNNLGKVRVKFNQIFEKLEFEAQKVR